MNPRGLAAVLGLLFMWAQPVAAQVSIGIGLPNVNIGISVPVYPRLVQVPNYPVYYAPQLPSNYFFYDGWYWVYRSDRWYSSTWYDGPWGAVEPQFVPLFVLRIPVRYYRDPPPYFRAWRPEAPPRWGEHWGHEWEQRRSGWDRWDRHSVRAPAPLPTYQQRYAGDRYPRVDARQHELLQQHYRYQPRDPGVRQHRDPAAQRVPPSGAGAGDHRDGPRSGAPGNDRRSGRQKNDEQDRDKGDDRGGERKR